MNQHRIFPIVEEPLGLVRYVRTARDVGSAHTLRAAFTTALTRSRKIAEREQLPARDVDDMIFAMVALIDEVVLSRGGALTHDWMRQQLQLSMFGENRAGETFFERLTEVRRDPHRTHVLSVFYLVLSVGFRGKFASNELLLHEELEHVRLELERRGALEERPLSPSVARPPDGRARITDGRAVLAVGVIAMALAGVLWVGLSIDLGVRREAVATLLFNA
jgi:type VI secretion system protein ImpK